MAEELKPDEKKEDPKSESSTDGAPEDKSPSDAKSEPGEKKKEKFVPMSRFEEVINQKNDLSRRLEALESHAEERTEKSKSNPVDESVKRLVNQGMEESNARALAESQLALATSVVEEKVAPIQRSTAQAEIDALVQDLASRHKDYYDLESEMYEVYRGLDPDAQKFVASSRKGLEMLYKSVKSDKLQGLVDKGYKQGVEDGYKNKRDKSAASSESVGGSIDTGLPSPKSIDEMSLDEYKKKREMILKNQEKISQV